MARLTIDTGAVGNPATGDTLRTAMTKVNSNFAELAGDLQMSGNTLLSADTNGNIILDPNGTGTVELVVPVQTTVGSAGSAASLPAQPSTYFKINVAGTEYVVPAYAVS